MKKLVKKSLIFLGVVLALSALLSDTILYTMTAKSQFIKPVSMVVNQSITAIGEITWRNTVDVFYHSAAEYNLLLEQVDITSGQVISDNDVIATAKLDAAYNEKMSACKDALESLKGELIRLDKHISDANIDFSAKNFTRGIWLFDADDRVFALRLALYTRAADVGIRLSENEALWDETVAQSGDEELGKIYRELRAAEAELAEIDSEKVLKQMPQKALDAYLQRMGIQRQLERAEQELIDLTLLGSDLSALRAPGSGTVVFVFAKSGQTYDGATAFYTYSEDVHPQVIAQVSSAEVISPGAVCAVNISGRSYAGEVAALLKTDAEDPQTLNVAIEITEEGFYDNPDDVSCLIGRSVDVEVIHEMGYFESVVPLTAIVAEGGSSYLYVVSAQESIWGEEYTVNKTEVQIIAKNARYAAVGFSTRRDEWIADMWDREIVDGARIMRAPS